MARPDKVAAAAIELLAANPTRHGQATFAALIEIVEERYPGAIERARARRKAKAFDSKFVGPVPDWAKRYVKKHYPSLRLMKWRRSKVTLRGTCETWTSTITVTERTGTSEERMRILVLHEIAHQVGYGHDDKYAAELRRLLVAEGLYRAALKSGLSGQSRLRRVKAAATREPRMPL